MQRRKLVAFSLGAPLLSGERLLTLAPFVAGRYDELRQRYVLAARTP